MRQAVDRQSLTKSVKSTYRMLKFFKGGNGVPAEVVRVDFNLSVRYALGCVAEGSLITHLKSQKVGL